LQRPSVLAFRLAKFWAFDHRFVICEQGSDKERRGEGSLIYALGFALAATGCSSLVIISFSGGCVDPLCLQVGDELTLVQDGG